MRQKELLLLLVMMVGIFINPSFTFAENSGRNKKPIEINPSKLKIEVGKSKSFTVKCTKEHNAKVEEHCTWLIVPDSLGVFNNNNFKATAKGSGIIVSYYKEYADTCRIEITSKANTNDEDKGNNGHKPNNETYPKITFNGNQNLALLVGESDTISPTFWVAEDSSITVDFDFSLKPIIVGTITNEGVLTAEHVGNAKLNVSFGEISTSIRIKVSKNRNANVDEYPSLSIPLKRVNIKNGEFVELMAVFADSSGNITPVSPVWSVNPNYLGHFSDSIFYADSTGKGHLIAEYEGLIDSIPLNVQNTPEFENIWSKFRILIQPADTSIAIGDSVQYSLEVINKRNWQLEIDSTLLDSIFVEWDVVGQNVGDITDDGLFTATNNGFAIIKAKINGEKAITTRIIVDNGIAIEDSTGINKVEIQRVLPNGNILPSKTISEGDSYRITGLPFPLNVLNAGLLYFPVGSLKEDISIFMMLPEQIQEDSTGIIQTDSVIAGVKFVVTVGDSIVEPYYFEQPLILSIPYKSELLDSLGIPPEEIGLFFADNGDYTETGITNVYVDTIENRIIAEVVHFSSLVIRRNYSTAETNTTDNKTLKTAITNLKIAPNPFIDQTTISYNVTDKKDIDLLIYNISGQLINSYSFNNSEGHFSYTWDGKNKRGTTVQPGLYICRLLENGKQIAINKMVKMGL